MTSLHPRLALAATLFFTGQLIAQQPTAGGVAPVPPPAPVEPAPVVAPVVAPGSTAPVAPGSAAVPATVEEPAPIEPPVPPVAGQTGVPSDGSTAPVPGGVVSGSASDLSALASTGPAVHDFQGDEIGTVLRLLARQAKVPMVVSDQVAGTVTLRIEGRTALDVIRIICTSKNLFLDEIDGVYYVKTQAEKAAEPTEPGSYTFSYAKAEIAAPLLQSQLRSGAPPQVDVRTNTIFYREVKSNLEGVKDFLRIIDKPTQQVMIEARLVEVNANPRQSYGINWGGVFGSSVSPQRVAWGASQIGTVGTQTLTGANGESVTVNQTKYDVQFNPNGSPTLYNMLLGGDQTTFGNRPLNILGDPQQLAILSVPQMSVTLRMLNEDQDAEFLANPRIVTANNQQAMIKITRNQPVPQLNFNEQTSTAVFGGFEDKEFGNTLNVTPSINKDDFVTLQVKPEISNKVADLNFTFSGATVSSPIIDKRQLESSVLIKSGDTLAIGGLLQDEVTKNRAKVPVLGDIPVLGYAFQERINARTKRNLLIFVTPTIIKQGYGTGLEDQATGLNYSGDEYADPNGWRNNARGAVRIVPTSARQLAADYPVPGTAIQPNSVTRYKAGAPAREK